MQPGTGRARGNQVAMGIAASVALALAVAACSSAPDDASTHPVTAKSVVPVKPLHKAGHTSTTAPPAGYPAVRGKVEIYVRVPATRTPSNGRSFVISVVLVNGLGHSFAVPGSCNGWLAVGLASTAIRFEPAYTIIGCPSNAIRQGTTRLSRTIATTYQSCSQDPHAVLTADFPACVGIDDNQMPNLPAARYWLKLDTSSIPHPVIATPVTITLTRS